MLNPPRVFSQIQLTNLRDLTFFSYCKQARKLEYLTNWWDQIGEMQQLAKPPGDRVSSNDWPSQT